MQASAITCSAKHAALILLYCVGTQTSVAVSLYPLIIRDIYQ